MRAPERPDNSPLFEYTLMPTHMRERFSPEELREAELVPPFTFTKGCPLLKLPARPWVDAHPFGTLLFDLDTDPGQEAPFSDEAVEAIMIRHLVKLMRANDAPNDQFIRLGLADGGNH